MLRHLSIRNLVLIEKLDLDFEKGLTALTGETGAGKSMLLDAIMLIAGERADNSLVRANASQMTITAVFEKTPAACFLIKEQGILLEEESDIMIRRVVDQQGKSKAFVNDDVVTLSFLKKLTAELIEIHGQFDRLLEPSRYRAVLDGFSDRKDLLPKVGESFKNYKAHQETLDRFLQKGEDIDDLRQEAVRALKEFESLKPLPQEEESLVAERERLKNGVLNAKTVQESLTLLNTALLPQLSSLEKMMKKLEGQDGLYARLENHIIEMTDLEQELRHLRDSCDADPQRFDAIDDRLMTLRSLARKHKTTPDALFEKHAALKQELDDLEDWEAQLQKLEKARDEIKDFYVNLCQELHDSRKKAASVLTKKIMQELPALKLEHAQFQVDVNALPFENASSHGMDKIEFMFSANPGVGFQPLSKVASGGELSRLMLALKVSLTENTALTSIIFDEIDSGVGGATAFSIGARLKKLSEHGQVLVITHAPQVASYAHQHLKVKKEVKENLTHTCVELLPNDLRMTEIARMLSGENITAEALIAAKSLCEQAQSLSQGV